MNATSIQPSPAESLADALCDFLGEYRAIRALRIERGLPEHPEATAMRARLRPISKMHAMNGEDRACAVFDWLCFSDGIHPAIPHDVKSIKREFRFGGGMRVDRAIFHESGQLTLVEIKDCSSTRDIVAGIGQALVYAALAEREHSNSPIVPALAVLGEPDQDIARACQLGGVLYLPLGGLHGWRTFSKLCEVMFDHE